MVDDEEAEASSSSLLAQLHMHSQQNVSQILSKQPRGGQEGAGGADKQRSRVCPGLEISSERGCAHSRQEKQDKTHQEGKHLFGQVCHLFLGRGQGIRAQRLRGWISVWSQHSSRRLWWWWWWTSHPSIDRLVGWWQTWPEVELVQREVQGRFTSQVKWRLWFIGVTCHFWLEPIRGRT